MAGIPEVQLAAFLSRSSCCLSRVASTSGDYGSCSSLKPLPCRALQTAGSALPGNGDGFPRIGLDLAVSMFAPCLLGCRDTARQRPVPGGSRSRGLLHGPAGSSITRHQRVLSNTLSSGLLISGYISPVAGLYGNQAAISLTAATTGHLGLVTRPVTGTAIRRVHDRCITGPRQVHDRLRWIQSQRAAGTRPPPPCQPRREGAGRSGSLPRPQVRTRPARRPAGAARRRNRRPGCRGMHQSGEQFGRPRNGTKRARIGKASGSTDRLLCPDAVRHMSVTIATQ